MTVRPELEPGVCESFDFQTTANRRATRGRIYSAGVSVSVFIHDSDYDIDNVWRERDREAGARARSV